MGCRLERTPVPRLLLPCGGGGTYQGKMNVLIVCKCSERCARLSAPVGTMPIRAISNPPRMEVAIISKWMRLPASNAAAQC